MLISPPGTPVSDPFFAEVRRRHPDVDLVMLPPDDEPGAESDVQVSDDVVVELRTRVAEETARLWSVMVPGDPVEPQVSLRYGDDDPGVRAIALETTVSHDGSEVLERLRHDLEQQGQDVRVRPGGVVRLEATHGDLSVTATYAVSTGAMVLTVRSSSVSVGVERAKALVRAGGRRWR